MDRRKWDVIPGVSVVHPPSRLARVGLFGFAVGFACLDLDDELRRFEKIV